MIDTTLCILTFFECAFAGAYARKQNPILPEGFKGLDYFTAGKFSLTIVL